MKALVKRSLGRKFSRDFLEKLTEYSIAETEPAVSLSEAEHLMPEGSDWVSVIERGREELWRRTYSEYSDKPRLWLEFGVYKGESLRFFAGLDQNPSSRFIGFDSFEGLPEDWRGMAAERFDLGGNIPVIEDPRVRFVRGWFQDSLPPIISELRESLADGRELVVHFDADLYSSTLFLLFALHDLTDRYHFIFDEFSGHETRALFNFLQASGATAKYSHRLDWRGFPQIVSGQMFALARKAT